MPVTKKKKKLTVSNEVSQSGIFWYTLTPNHRGTANRKNKLFDYVSL